MRWHIVKIIVHHDGHTQLRLICIGFSPCSLIVKYRRYKKLLLQDSAEPCSRVLVFFYTGNIPHKKITGQKELQNWPVIGVYRYTPVFDQLSHLLRSPGQDKVKIFTGHAVNSFPDISLSALERDIPAKHYQIK